jgi:hypothetical protein
MSSSHFYPQADYPNTTSFSLFINSHEKIKSTQKIKYSIESMIKEKLIKKNQSA